MFMGMTKEPLSSIHGPPQYLVKITKAKGEITVGNTTLVEDKHIRILRTLSGLCGVSVPFTLTSMLAIGYFNLENYLSFGQVAYFGLTGGVIYVILTLTAYRDCQERDLTPLEREFCTGVLLTCNYQFAGTPSYFEIIQGMLDAKEMTKRERRVGRHLGNVLYHILTFQVLGFIGCLALCVLAAGLSILFVQLIEVPLIIIEWAIIIITPFPFVAYAFCSRMLYEMTQHSLDAADLKYYFSVKHGLFGALRYYDETRAPSSPGAPGLYRRIFNATIRIS